MTTYSEVEVDDLNEGFERIVHAKYNGVEVVRYGDEWYLEPTRGYANREHYDGGVREKESPLNKKTKVTMEEAAKDAANGVWDAWQPSNRAWPAGFQVYFGQEGGEEFDEIVKAMYPMLYIETKFVDLGDGHEFMAMACPGCGELMHIDDTQTGGKACTDHARHIGGCGFHGYTFGDHSGYIIEFGDVYYKKKEEALKKAKSPARQKVKV